MTSRLTLTVAETAERLGVSPRTVNDWCVAGRIPALRVGKRWLIPVRDLEAFVADRTRRPAPAPPSESVPPPVVPLARTAPRRRGHRTVLAEKGF